MEDGMKKIAWFRTSVGDPEVELIREAISHECISMGPYTQQLEEALSKQLGIPFCVALPSGSVALLVSLLALGIGQGDEVIVPDRGWIAAAHAVFLLGAKPVLVDVRRDLPVMDMDDVCRRVNSKTRAIIPVHLNGRSVDMKRLVPFCQDRGIKIIEDACQSLFSRNGEGFLGTQGDIGCFSFGMAKLVACGQGGLAVTRDEKLYRKLQALRNHGVQDNFTRTWDQFGFNFKFTDLQAAMGLAQLERIPGRLKHLRKVYEIYESGFRSLTRMKIIPVDVDNGEVPLFVEALADHRDKLIDAMKAKGIQLRPSIPDLDPAPYFNVQGEFPNSRMFHHHGLFLPCGPEQPLANIDRVIIALKEFERENERNGS